MKEGEGINCLFSTPTLVLTALITGRNYLPRKISKQRLFAKNVQNIRRKDSYWQVYTEKIYSSFDGHTFLEKLKEMLQSFPLVSQGILFSFMNFRLYIFVLGYPNITFISYSLRIYSMNCIDVMISALRRCKFQTTNFTFIGFFTFMHCFNVSSQMTFS